VLPGLAARRGFSFTPAGEDGALWGERVSARWRDVVFPGVSGHSTSARSTNGSTGATSVHAAGSENSSPSSSCRWTRSSPQFWRCTTSSKSRPNNGWNRWVTRTRRYRSSGSDVVDDVVQLLCRTVRPQRPRGMHRQNADLPRTTRPYRPRPVRTPLQQPPATPKPQPTPAQPRSTHRDTPRRPDPASTSPRRSHQRVPASRLALPEERLVKGLHRVLARYSPSTARAMSPPRSLRVRYGWRPEAPTVGGLRRTHARGLIQDTLR
jgi:hypothetical protein